VKGCYLEGNGESGMESFVRKEGGNPCGRVGHVIVGELGDGKLWFPVVL